MLLHVTIWLSLVSTKLPFHLLISVTIIPLLFQQGESQNRMSCLLSFSLMNEVITRFRIWQIFPVNSLSPFSYCFQPFHFFCVLGVLRCISPDVLYWANVSWAIHVQRCSYSFGKARKPCGKRTENQWAFTGRGRNYWCLVCGIVCNGAHGTVVCQAV